MSKGFDCATPLTKATAESFKSNGYDFVCRYLVPATSAWKALTKAEADIIQAAGMYIVSVYETTADRALGGRAAGLIDGAIAVKCAAEVGQPKGSTIYGAVDFAPTPAQMKTVVEYIRGFNDAMPEFSTGVYGSFDVVNAVKAAGAASHLWQTYAWSRGQLADVQIYQWQNGEQYDEDKSFGLEGWWGTLAAPAPAATTSLDPGVALTVINTWIKKSYDVTSNAEQRNYYHWLANQLRLAAGLELEQ